MECVYLIGGSGFIGKNLVECLINDFELVVVDKFIDEPFFNSLTQVKTLRIDLAEERIPDGFPIPHYVINLASIVTAERDFSLFDKLISSNLKVLLNLYERFKDDKFLKLFIQFGSCEEYGNESPPFFENVRESPNSPYALVKQLTVNTVLMLNANYGFPAMVVRPGNLFGKYQNKEKFLPYVISRLKNNQPINVTPCEQKRDFIYSTDFAWCIKKLIQNYRKVIGQIINVSSGESISLREIIEICRNHIGSFSQINYGAFPYRDNEIMDMRCSVDRLSAIIGHEIEFNIKSRLKEYINTL